MFHQAKVECASAEFAQADLGDQRRTGRLCEIAKLLETEPAKSFPQAMGSDAALEALYRFINNSGSSPSDIVAPHVAATLKRAAAAGTVIAVHDTTYVEYGAVRTDLGPTTGKNHFGYVAHAALLLAENSGIPLGVAHLETFTRTGKKWRKRKKEGQRGRLNKHDKTRESLRWLRGLEALETVKVGRFEVIHVTDAEGDFFGLLASLHNQSARFVIRAGQFDRIVASNGELCSLRQVADQILPRTWRKVELSERKHPRRANITTRRRHPERAAHIARLAIGATRVVFDKSHYSDLKAEPFEVNVVRVWEPAPPRGQPAVEWILLTTEDTSSRKALERIVDLYRQRWTIEEYFKALKSGCAIEKRQVESYDALCKVLALFVPIAYRLLLLRALDRIDSKVTSTKAFSRAELTLLARSPSNQRLPFPRTVAEAISHLARLGGHIRNNGRPGWQTLARGYEKLLVMKLGWEIAMSSNWAGKCDQS